MAESLRAFILKAEVIKLYRSFWRTVKEAPLHTRGELCLRRTLHCGHGMCVPSCVHAGELEEQVRQGFEQHRNVQELYQVKYHLSDG